MAINFVDKKYYFCGGHTLIKNEVDIDINDLQSLDNKEMLLSILHNSRHVYQKCVCDLYLRASKEEKALLLFSGVDEWCSGLYKFSYGTLDEPVISSGAEFDAYDYSFKEVDEYLNELNNP